MTIKAAMTMDEVAQLLADRGLEVSIRDLGSSGGGDWCGVQVDISDGGFILITPDDAPWDANADDTEVERLLAYRYGPGEFEDEGDRPWVGLTEWHTDEALVFNWTSPRDTFDATVPALIDHVAALVNLAPDWENADVEDVRAENLAYMLANPDIYGPRNA